MQIRCIRVIGSISRHSWPSTAYWLSPVLRNQHFLLDLICCPAHWKCLERFLMQKLIFRRRKLENMIQFNYLVNIEFFRFLKHPCLIIGFIGALPNDEISLSPIFMNGIDFARNRCLNALGVCITWYSIRFHRVSNVTFNLFQSFSHILFYWNVIIHF